MSGAHRAPSKPPRFNLTARKVRKPFAILAALSVVMLGIIPLSQANAEDSPTGASIVSEFPDYPAGSTVRLLGQGWAPDELISIEVNDTLGRTWQHTGQINADSQGAFEYPVKISDKFISDYDVKASGAISGTATTTFTDAPPGPGQLEQCDPPTPYSQTTYTCATSGPTGWVSGNNDGIFYEGETIPYRLPLDNLVVGNQYSVTIGWDTTKSGKHALDYLKTYNATVQGADPCSGLSATWCSGSPTTVPIPADGTMTARPDWTGTQDAGVMTMFGGTLAAPGAYTVSGSYTTDSTTFLTFTFTANSANALMTWGGHIAERADWGLNNSAASIDGSPYHMRMDNMRDVTNDELLSKASQDRSLSAGAIVYPGSITIVKDAQPNGSTSFPFTASPSPLTNFSLVDDGTNANTKSFNNITDFDDPFTVTETPVPNGWSWSSIDCSVTSPNDGKQTKGNATVTIELAEGENVTCTFVNSQNVADALDLEVSKTADASYSREYDWSVEKGVTDEEETSDGSAVTSDYTINVERSETDSGFTVSGEITVTNPNSVAVPLNDITDDIDDGAGTCVLDDAVPASVPGVGSVTVDYTCTFDSEPTSETGTNTAQVDWDDSFSVDGVQYNTPSASDTATADYDFADVDPSITGDESVFVGDSNTPDAGSIVIDPADGDPVAADAFPVEVFDDAEITYSVTREDLVAGTCTNYPNTAAIYSSVELTEQTEIDSDDASVEICVGSNLSVDKTVDASNARTYKWLISKASDETRIEIAEGGSATFNYTVTATPNGFDDSAFEVSGTITVTNPNDWQSVTLTDLTDELDGAGTCEITDPAPYVVPMAEKDQNDVLQDGELTVDYTCTGEDGSETENEATATWNAETFNTPDGSASATEDVTYKVTSEANKTITVVDDKTDPDSPPVELGTATWGDDPTKFEYSLTKDGVAGTCTNYTNTAVIEETGQEADETVTVCVGSNLSVDKTVDASNARTYKWLISKASDETRIEIAEGGSATFNYTVTATPNGFDDSAFEVSGTITVTNPNDWQSVTLTDLTDELDGAGTCEITDPAPYVVPMAEKDQNDVLQDGELTVDYTCTGEDGSETENEATATWNAETFNTPDGSASATEDVTYKVTSEANKTITVVDDKTDPDSPPVELGTATWGDDPTKFEYSLTKDGVAGTCTNYTNTAVIEETGQEADETVTVCVGSNLSVDKTVDASNARTYKWLISKASDETRIEIAEGGSATFNYTVTATPNGFDDSAFEVSGTITVTNPNDWQSVTLTDLTDELDGAGTCEITDPAPYVVPMAEKDQNDVLQDGELTVDYTCTGEDGSETENEATATWNAETFNTPDGSASATEDVTYKVTSEANKTITVVDDKTDPDSPPVELGTATWGDDPTKFEYSLTKDGVAGTCTNYTNTAVIEETGQEADETVTVCVGSNLSVDKTVDASNARTYKWLISKASDETRIEIAEGGSATFNYTVTATPNGFDDSAFEVSGTITVTNPNDWQSVTLTDLTDELDGAGTCEITDPAPYVVPMAEKDQNDVLQDGELTVDYTCTGEDGSETENEATATWNAETFNTPDGSASATEDVTYKVTSEANKTITVVDDKTDPDSPPVELGTATWGDDPTKFEYSLTKDGVAGTCTNYTNTAVIEETGQEADETVTVCVGSNLSVDKTVDASNARTYKWLISKASDETRIEIAEGGSATFNYTVTATPNGFDDSAFEVSGTITVTNPNDWQSVTLTDLTDELDGAGTCEITDPAPYVVPMAEKDQNDVLQDGELTVDYTCTGEDGSETENEATATWNAETFNTPDGSASATEDVTYKVTSEANKTITVVDDKTDPDSPPVELGTATWGDDPTKFEYSLTKDGVAGTCTNYTNTAVIEETGQEADETVTVCVGSNLSVDKTVDASNARTYKWLISKASDETRIEIAEGGSATFNYTVTATPNGFDDSAFEVSGTITVTNPNDWQSVTLTDLTDELDGAGTCEITDPAPYVVPMAEKDQNDVLQDGELTVDYTCTGEDGSETENEATATWNAETFNTPDGSASATEDVTYKVTSEANKTITVVDDKTDPDSPPVELGTATWGDDPTKFEYSLTKDGVAGTCTNYTNTAVIEETGQEADETVTVCVGSNLSVDKTFTPTFVRTYLWDITKSVDRTYVETAAATATFNYTVEVDTTGYEDSDWAGSGQITVTNPNDWQPITADITDTVNNGGTCTVTSGGPNDDGLAVEVPAADANGPGSVTVNYTCTFVTDSIGTNTATADWSADAVTPDTSASGTKAVAFSTPTTTVNDTITVDDTFNGVTGPIGTASITDDLPKSFEYSRTVNVPLGRCISYPNTATIVETGQSASQEVTVCGPEKTGAKTIGFWQNKNGQGIIAKTGPTTGTCSITPWLRQFAPFQDLSATAVCANTNDKKKTPDVDDVRSYVYDVIKLADSSGASMNAMLKAQMLATALDVYYSDPALGGNKIGAPAPIGEVVVDLTQICTDAGSCLTFQNVSSAFDNYTSRTVMQMLTIAASKSTVGGTTWYGNVKSTQELAKDAFDAINNEKVFSP